MTEIKLGGDPGVTNGLLPKASVLYLHAQGGRYDCQDCAGFIPEHRACAIVEGDIDPKASCGYFIPGPPCTLGDTSLALLTKSESGYVRAVGGASCKRCEYWCPSGDCAKVDKDSPGDDQGEIDGDGCCVLWEGK